MFSCTTLWCNEICQKSEKVLSRGRSCLKAKKTVGIERFDEERSDEEPCETSRPAKCSAATAHKISQPDPGVKRLKSAKSKKARRRQTCVCNAVTAVLRKRDFEAVYGKKAKKWSGNDRVIGATLFEAAKSHKTLVINVVYSQLRTRVLTAFFALLILRPSKSSLKTKGLALFDRHRYHSAENFLHQSPSS